MNSARRDFLHLMLGAAGLASACKRSTRRGPVPGELLDDSSAVGHTLREAGRPPSVAPQETVDVLVVGAGAAGLSAAWRLKDAGVSSLRVLEVASAPGGTARSGKNAVSAFPWGAHYLPAPLDGRGPVPRLLRQLGVLEGVDDEGHPRYAEQALIHDPDERLFYRGTWYDGLYLRAGASAEDLAQNARFEEQMQALAAARDGQGRRAFDVPLERGSDDAEWTALDRIPMSEWMAQQGFTSPRLNWLVDYACRDDYGMRPTETSAWAALWYFAARQGPEGKSSGYLSWPAGNGHLIAGLAASLQPGELRADTLVHTLSPDGEGWVAQAFDTRTRAPVALRARQVVLATPRFVAAHLLEPWRREPPSFLKAFTSSPWVVANLTVRQRPSSRGFPLAWDNVLHGSKSLGYVVATHQSDRSSEVGPTVLTWYYPLAGADVGKERSHLLESTYGDWEEALMADLGPAHFDLPEVAQRLEVLRWGHAMVRPTPGFLFGPARAAAQQSLGRALHFAHSDLGGLPLFEEANHWGVTAAERALSGLGLPVESWL